MWQLMETGAPEAGAMMHLATPELDAGPPVSYFHFPIRGPGFDPMWAVWKKKRQVGSLAEIQAEEGESEPLFALIRAEELRREFPLSLLTLKNLAEARFRLTRQEAEVQGQPISTGFDLTSQVEEFLKGVG